MSHALQIFVEAKRTSPSILYIPHIGQWWETVGPALRATFLSLLSSIPAFAPILLLATCNLQYAQLSMEVWKYSSGVTHSSARTPFTHLSPSLATGSGVVSCGVWGGFPRPCPHQQGKKKLF